KGTQNVLKGLGQPDQFKPGIHGVLASFIEAENTCARAIEAALGSHLQTVLVQDQAVAEAIIQRLTEKSLGIAAILPETFVGHSAGTQMEALPEGATAWALDRVKSDKRVTPIIEKLLDKTLIVPNLSTALRIRPQLPGVTIITLAGVILGGEGTLRGGATPEGNASFLERQNEVRSLENEVADLTAADEAARTRVTDLEARLEQFREEVEISRERLQRQKVDL